MKLKRTHLICAVALCVLAVAGMQLLGPSGAARPATIHEAGWFDFRCYDAQGDLKWQELNRPNGLANEGQYAFLDGVLRGGTEPSAYYLRLYNATVVKTNVLADISATEPAGTYGYAAQSLTKDGTATGWPTLVLDSGDYMATSATKTFSAVGGSWGPVTYGVLASTSGAGGKLISYVQLSQSRTLASGESLQVTYKLKLQ